MAKEKKIVNLEVYLNSEYVGVLTRKSTGALEFSYVESWLENDSSYPISQSLPLIETTYKGREVYSFFENLLPDNPEIKKMMAQKLKAKSDDAFDLLNMAGNDCVGAFQFRVSGSEKPILREIEGEEVTEEEIESILQNLSFNPLGNNPETEFRISIAGAQEKTALLRYNNKWLRPKGPTPTSHIFKPPLGKFPNGIDMSTSVENEWLCCEIIKKLGLPIASTSIEVFGEQKCLVVERFDRKWLDEKKLTRIPQEDLCQALGVNSATKYESDGGPGIQKIMSFLDASDEAFKDKKMFFKTQIAFFLLAAIDGHGKNFSIFQTRSGFQMTPLYDVLSAYPAIAKNQVQKEKARLAMCVGNSRHYKLSKIFRRHWLETAKKCKFPEKVVLDIIDETAAQMTQLLDDGIPLPKNYLSEVYESTMEGIRKSLSKLN